VKIRVAGAKDRPAMLGLLKRIIGERWAETREKYRRLLFEPNALKWYVVVGEGPVIALAALRSVELFTCGKPIQASVILCACAESGEEKAFEALMRFCEAEARREGARLLYGPRCRRLRSALGMVEVGRRRLVSVHRGADLSGAPVRFATEEDLPSLYALASRRAVRFVKNERDYGALLARAKKRREAFLVVLFRDRVCVSYLLLARPLAWEFGCGSPALCTDEYGGDLRLVFENLSSVCGFLNEPYMLYVRPEDEAFLDTPDITCNVEVKCSAVPGLLKVIAPRKLWHDLAGSGAVWPPPGTGELNTLQAWTYWFFGEPGHPPGTRECAGVRLPIPAAGVDSALAALQ